MRKLIILFLIFYCSIGFSTPTFRIMFYNVENYFDTTDDPERNDNDFLPDGKKHWTSSKMEEKKNSIARVIATVGEGTPPAIVGLCEVENDYVLKLLTRYSPIKKWKYNFVHYESPDSRGIDVALLYDKTQFELISSKCIPIIFSKGRSTRDILYVSGKTNNGILLHVFVTHAPSRIGGKNNSEPRRVAVMSMIKQHCDSILAVNSNANIVIMGDFNDTPEDKSIRVTLGAKPLVEPFCNDSLYNMLYSFVGNPYIGTHKHQSQWSVLDQIIVSGNLLNTGLLNPNSAYIFRADFLLEEDKRNMNVRPKRTYNGLRYQEGYSDHLPVVIKLETQSFIQ